MKAELILQFVSDETGIPVEDILLEDRMLGSHRPDIVAARHVAMVLMLRYAKRQVDFRIKDVQQVMNRKTHGAVISAVASVEANRATDKDYKRKFDEIESKLLKTC